MGKAIIIGLTGPTGAGKSTVALEAEKIGFYVIDADGVARRCTQKGSPLLPKLKEAFGDVLEPDGTLSRAKLAAVAFSDREKTDKLNAVMLPFIVDRIDMEINRASTKFDKILLDAPTLFEAGADRLCDDVIAVLSPADRRLKRIITRDGLTVDAAKVRMNAGKPDRYYEGLCRHIIYNNGTEPELCEKARRVLEKIVCEVEN